MVRQGPEGWNAEEWRQSEVSPESGGPIPGKVGSPIVGSRRPDHC